MFDAQQVKTGLIGIVGWRQNNDAAGVQLVELTTSSSGLWYGSQHPLLTIDNLVSHAPDFNAQGLSQVEQNVEFTAWLKERTEDGIVEAINDWLAVSGLRDNFLCNYTDEILEQKGQFARVVALRVASDLLRIVAFNPNARNNRSERNPNTERPVVLFETDGDTQGRNDFSLAGKYKKALASVSFDTTNIDEKCLKCRRTRIRNRTLGPRTY